MPIGSEHQSKRLQYLDNHKHPPRPIHHDKYCRSYLAASGVILGVGVDVNVGVVVGDAVIVAVTLGVGVLVGV
jgi:hypothetical protein